MNDKEKTLIFGGQARLPRELSVVEVFQVVAVVEVDTGKVVETDFTPCPPLITSMLKQITAGMSLQSDASDLLNEIEQRLHHKSKKAVITSIKDLFREYREYQYRVSRGAHPSVLGPSDAPCQ